MSRRAKSRLPEPTHGQPTSKGEVDSSHFTQVHGHAYTHAHAHGHTPSGSEKGGKALHHPTFHLITSLRCSLGFLHWVPLTFGVLLTIGAQLTFEVR